MRLPTCLRLIGASALVAWAPAALAVELLANPDFEEVQRDADTGDLNLDPAGNPLPLAWFQAVPAGPSENPPRTRLLTTDDSDGLGSQAVSLNANDSQFPGFGFPADYRSVAFATAPGRRAFLSFDFKWVDVDQLTDDSFRILLRSFTDEADGSTAGTFLGQLDVVLRVDDPLYPNQGEWYSRLATAYDVPAGGIFGDVMFAINTFGLDTLLDGSVRIDKASVIQLLSDANADDIVDGSDLATLLSALGSPSTIDGGDADGDGRTTGADFLIWQREFGEDYSAIPSAANSALQGGSVPEPSSLAALLTASCVAAWRGERRRK